MPISSGLPIWTGAPCTAGKRVVIWMARIASAGFIGRMDTTMGPWNGPAGAVAIEVRYIGTVALQVGADVEIIGQGRQPKVAGRGGRKQRARLRIEVAEAQKMAGEILRQDREISLHVAGRDAGGLAGEPAGASGEPRGPTRLGDAF